MSATEIDLPEQDTKEGYVYVLAVKDMDLPVCKIGRTGKDPALRCAQINRSSTGDFLWKVVYQIAVSDCHKLESLVHAELQDRRQRGREFFNLAPDAAIPTIHTVLGLAPGVRVIALAEQVIAADRKGRPRAPSVRPERDVVYAHLLDSFNQTLGIHGTPFGQLNKPHFGISDGREGVQWNLAIFPKDDWARVAVNLEGKKYRGWPIGKLIKAELEDPQLLRVVPHLVDAQSITLRFARDAWQASARSTIVEEYLGGREYRLSELTADSWRSMLTEALECLDKDKDYLGRALQPVTLQSAPEAGPRTVQVSPHLTVWIGIDPSRDSSDELSSAIERLKPIHEWASRVSGEARPTMVLYESAEAANAAAVRNTVLAATKAGLTTQVVDDGHILCSRPGSSELVDVFPDGSWEYQDVKEDKTMRAMSGVNASMLALYLHSDENKKLFHADADED